MNERAIHLAWHETLELHELVAMQSLALMKLRMFYPKVQNTMLQQLYRQTISDLENNLHELTRFYPKAPRKVNKDEVSELDDSFYAGELLSFSKVAVKNYATAITETATASLKLTLVKQLNKAIMLHTKVFNYMYKNGEYPAYDLKELLEGDMEK